ncbi:MAG TPA: hypothetical protein QF804_03495 [Rhodospirillales bacterium]|nr:hypothetical protein [Rhodospirillales bacterium]
MTKLTPEKIGAMAPGDRARLYARATNTDSDEARRVVEWIEEAGLPFSEQGSVKLDDPLCEAMQAVVDSDDGLIACIKATDEGWPAIAGVDPLLSVKFGVDYGKHNMTTHWAGRFVADVMRRHGYVQVGKEADTPEGCVARSGEVYAKK